MIERELAERFNRDVDAGRASDATAPAAEYDALLALAHALAESDLSDESQIQGSLRRRLLSEAKAWEGWSARKESVMATLQHMSLRGRLGLAIGGALLLLVMIMLLYPGGPANAAGRIGDGLKLIVLGANTTAQRVESFVTGKPVPDNTWVVQPFPGFGIGGNAPPGVTPQVISMADLGEAQKMLTFVVRTPGYLPEGYALREVKLAPVWTGLEAQLFPNSPSAFLFYGGPHADIVIIEQPVGPRPGGTPDTAIGQMVGFVTNGQLVEVQLDWRQAAWADDQMLMWEQDGISYVVGGPGLGLDAALQIAASLK